MSMPVANDFGRNNPSLRQLLTIQDQNQLLKKLVEREKSVNDMIQAAVGIGILHPPVPAPDKALCSAVPANIPCAQAYASLYSDFSLTPVKQEVATAAATPAPLPEAPSIMENTDIPALSAKNLSALPEPVLASAPIYWTDITCLGMKCSAVISPDPGNPKARYRIVTGEKLSDGSVVQSISAAGVTLNRDNKPVRLEPAPASS